MRRYCCETVYCEAECGRSRHWCEVGDTYTCEAAVLWRFDVTPPQPSPATSDEPDM